MLKVKNLSRTYGELIAADDVSFSIQSGEIVGLLGHNGAGKTTIMKMLSGYLEPSSGKIEIDGIDLSKNLSGAQSRLGYLPEVLPVYPEMSVADYLNYAANLKGLTREEATQEVSRVIRDTHLISKILAPISTLSRGYKQRVGVAQAIIGRPKLLILDEPTNGLDPTQTHQMRRLIQELSKEATVILSTHIMQEVDAICDRVLMMRAGQLVVDEKLIELRKSNSLTFSSDLEPLEAEAMFKTIEAIQHVNPISSEKKHRYQIVLKEDFDNAEAANDIAKIVIENKYALYELSHEQRDLESVFREVNEREEFADAA